MSVANDERVGSRRIVLRYVMWFLYGMALFLLFTAPSGEGRTPCRKALVEVFESEPSTCLHNAASQVGWSAFLLLVAAPVAVAYLMSPRSTSTPYSHG